MVEEWKGCAVGEEQVLCVVGENGSLPTHDSKKMREKPNACNSMKVPVW